MKAASTFNAPMAAANAVLAAWVVFVPGAAVGTAGTPVKVGDARFAFKLSAVVANSVVASWVVLVAAAAVGPAGTPVKVGEAMFALRLSAVVTKAVDAAWVVLVAAAAVGTVGTPVNAGEARGAFSKSSVSRLSLTVGPPAVEVSVMLALLELATLCPSRWLMATPPIRAR